MQRQFKALLFITCCFLLLTSCSYSGELKEVQARTNSGKVNYAISFPDYMSRETEKKLGEDASLQYASFYRNIYGIVMDKEVKKKESSSDSIEVSLEDFYRQELVKLESYLKNPLRLDSSRVEVAGNPAYHIQVVGKIGEGEVEKRILYRLVFFEAEEHFFHLALWGWDERRDSFIEDFDKIVGSFRINSTK